MKGLIQISLWQLVVIKLSNQALAVSNDGYNVIIYLME